MSSKSVSVVVIGGSHAGLAVCHKLLKRASTDSITLINPSEEYYFNIAAPRFLVKPDSLPQSSYLYSIPDSFRDYPAGSFTFVRGLVTRIDYAKKVVFTSMSSESTANTDAAFAFDYLVIASGSTTPATLGRAGIKLPFKATAFEDTKAAICEAQEELKAAQRVVIGGGGPLGVEMAGELAEASGAKKVTLVSQTSSLLVGATQTVQKTAFSLLRRKNVEILASVRVDSAEYDAGAKTWTVKLSSGQTIIADAYIATTGVVPNNDFIPDGFLNSEGWVNVDDQLRVVLKGKSCSDMYALGDITMHPYRLLSRVSLQGETVASNIAASIAQQNSAATYSAESQKKMMVVPIGQSTGTGHFGSWTLFGCIVWFFKGKDFLVYEAPKFLRGQRK
jgi:NADH dehydrogenase FAD-containing subunit